MQLVRCEMPPFYRWLSPQQSNTDISNVQEDIGDVLKIKPSKNSKEIYSELYKSAEFNKETNKARKIRIFVYLIFRTRRILILSLQIAYLINFQCLLTADIMPDYLAYYLLQLILFILFLGK